MKLHKKPFFFVELLFLLMTTACSADNGTEGAFDPPLPYWENSVAKPGLHLKHSSLISKKTAPVLLLGEEPFYGAGVNCYDLFNISLSRSGDVCSFDVSKSYEVLDTLKANQVPVVRFNCGIYSASDMVFYAEHQQAYLDALRQVAAYAEELEIGLIPSFFWNYQAASKYYQEPYRKWGDEQSQTYAYLIDYTTQVVMALNSYKSIFAWEFGNELNLAADLPNWQDIFQTDDPQNWIKGVDLQVAFKGFSETVRRCDPSQRIILSGNSELRASQYHQYRENSWSDDSVEEYRLITDYLTPAPMDCISEHLYAGGHRFSDRGTVSLEEQITIALESACKLGKGYIVGEYGAVTDENTYRRHLQAYVSQRVPLSLVWNFSIKGNIEHSFTATEERGKMIFGLLREYNAKYAQMQ